MHPVRLVPTLLLALLGAGPAAAQQFVLTPPDMIANDITPDGEIVVGQAPGGGFLWRWRQDPAPTVITGGLTIVATSDDGSVLAGTMIDPNGTGADVAAIWTETLGWQSLGYLPNALNCPSRSTAYDISGDGSTVVGLSWDGCSGRGFRWTAATGMQELEFLGTGSNRASAISGDGSTIGGFAASSLANRTMAYWQTDLSGALPDPAAEGEVAGLSGDGSISVGRRNTGGLGPLTAFKREGDGPWIDLGNLHSDWSATAEDVSEDGLVVVGYDSLMLALDAWLWTPITGIVGLDDLVADMDILGAPDLLFAKAVSDDGNVVVGGAAGPFGLAGYGFILEIGTDTWANPGGGTPGLNGVPTLDGWGGLVPDTPFYIQMQQARGSALTLLWLAAPSTPIQVFGGTLHAFPPVPGTELFLNTNGDGEFLGGALWPAGLPAGTEITFQFLIDDPFAFPWGINMSDGLRATTP